MRVLQRLGTVFVGGSAFALAAIFALELHTGGLRRGFGPVLALAGAAQKPAYDLTRLEAVNATLAMVEAKYVDPGRVKPREMFLSALDHVQRDVAQVIVQRDDVNVVTVRVDTSEKRFRVDDIRSLRDVSARLREVFAFVQKNLRGTDVDLREVEYAACNGMLHTLDPHSVLMSPDSYREMNLSTAGAFGGLGIVVSIRDQLLTVMNPMRDAPAGRAGLERLDRIVQINNESTLNMPLADAVKRMRGDPGTPVTIGVTRAGDGGWQGSRSFTLTREVIKVRSVEAHPLGQGVGYVRLKQFQESSAAELRAALDDLRSKGPIRGLVLDLRGNPGGLLDQAARVADEFLSEGTIVSTVGAFDGREERRARAAGTEPPYPLVVLVDGNSASASEVVAGALEGNDRALVVGQQTFGKGSVQGVFPDVTPDKAALKLTIAQYLTPGNVSIQGVGVTPDIELDPMTVDDVEMDLYARGDGFHERDLAAHLDSARAAPAGKPAETVRYDLPVAEREATRDRGGELDDDKFQVDFPIRFARDLAARLPPATKRLDELRAARGFIEQTRRDELGKVSTDLARLGVDWTDAPEGAQVAAGKDLEVKIGTDRPNNDVTAGQPMELRVTVTNKGERPVYRLRGTTGSDNPYLANKELVFGKIAAGQSRTASVALGFCSDGRKVGSSEARDERAARSCKIPMGALDRSDGLRVSFDAAAGGAPGPVEIRPTVHALPQPLFQYGYQIADDRGGNGDGRVQKGEHVTMYLTVKNAGKGRSYETHANIANLSGDALLLHAGRFDISNMMPGDVRRVAFTFDVAPKTTEDQVSLALSVADSDLGAFASEKVKIPLEAPAQITPASGAVKAGPEGATLLPSLDQRARGFGRLAPGTSAALIGKAGDVDKIDLGGGRFAFVSSREVTRGGSPRPTVPFADVYLHAPPALDVRAAAMATRDDKIKISGVATDSDRLLDVCIFVGSRKLYYRSNRDGADAKRAGIDFDAPLRPGVNVITVVARETPDTTSRRVIVVRKDGADGSILKTPKTDDPIMDGAIGSGGE